MEGRGGGRKRDYVWDHVEKLTGNRVMCKHCKFKFAATSATRITSHGYSIPNQGIRGCGVGLASSGASEAGLGNFEAVEEMALETDSVGIANMVPNKIKKRKVVPVELEHAKPNFRGCVRKSSVEAVRGEESLPIFALRGQKVASSPLDASLLLSDFHAPTDTQMNCCTRSFLQSNMAHPSSDIMMWHTIRLVVASSALASKLQDEKAKLQDELVNSEKEKAHLRGKIKDLEAKAEEASQFRNKKFEMEGKLEEASAKISSLNNQLSQVKAELDSVKKGHDVAAEEDKQKTSVGESENKLAEMGHYERCFSPDYDVNGEHNFHSGSNFDLICFPI